ncbi:MAG: PAS domain S-box protein, partial [Caldilineaceae bacterium]
MNSDVCDSILFDFPLLHPSYLGASVFDLDGNIICSSGSDALASGNAIKDLPVFNDFVRNGGVYTIGSLFEVPGSGQKVVAQLYPIYAQNGELVGALGGPLRLERLGELFETSHMPADTVAKLVHENGAIMGRSIDNEQWTGSALEKGSALLTAMTTPAGWTQGIGIGGEERLYGYSQVAGLPWYVFVGTSMDSVYASSQQLLIYNLGWDLLLLLLVFLVSLVIKRNIEDPIQSLVATAGAVAAGDQAQRAAVVGPREIEDVASSVNAMLNKLERANQVLQEGENRFRHVLENSQDAMYRLDLRTSRYEYISPVIGAILGYSTEHDVTLPEPDRARYVHPDDRERLIAEFTEAVGSTETNHYLEYRCIRQDGSVVWIGDKFSIQFDSDGAPHSIVGTLRDITGQKTAAEELHAYEERLRVIVEASPDLIVLIDEEGANLEILTQSSDVLDYPIQEVSGRSLADVFTAEETALFKQFIADAVTTEMPRTYEFPLEIGGVDHWLEARSAPLNLQQDGKRLILFIIRNVTARKVTEGELRKFTRAIEQSPESVVITDLDGQIEYVNPRFCQVTGYDRAEVIGQNPRVLKSGYQATEYYSDMWRQIATGHEWRGELCNRKKNGELFWEQASISPIKDEDGVTTHYLAIKEDITERKRIEDQLRQQDRLAGVGQLAAGIAHDFNNIMSAIILYARMLQQNANLSDKERARLNVINEQAQHAVNLIRQILDFSRRSLVERGAVDLAPFFKEMVKMWERTLPENIKVAFTYSDNHLIVNADPTRLQQAMLNLALNARDAMPDGGTLKIALQTESIGAGQTPPIQGMQPGNWLCITCEDSGVGI